jgi:hypothetical protein
MFSLASGPDTEYGGRALIVRPSVDRGPCHDATVPQAPGPGAGEGAEGDVVGVGQGVQVAFGGPHPGMPESFPDGL